jgi:amidase
MCQIAQGNDVAGSVRWPAYMNGVIGLRPTVHRMPTGGTNPAVGRAWTASEMSTNGVIARTMADIRNGYRIMTANNWNDPNWIPVPHEFPAAPVPKRVALVTDDGHDIASDTLDAIRRTGKILEAAGYEVDEVTPPKVDVFFGLWQRLGAIDMMFGLRPMLPAIGDSGLQTSIEDWASNFPAATPENFMSSLIDRDLLVREWNRFLAKYPIVVSPLMAKRTIPRGFDVEHPGAMAELVHVGRWGLNLSAIAMPALAFPVGFIDGAPMGVQLFAHSWREDVLLAAGDTLENALGVVRTVDVKW